MPLISIVTPSRNQARFLPRCLESVAREAARLPGGAIEHIIMDGGSTDASPEIIRAHAERHGELVTHWQSAPDAGQSAAINDGFDRAAGAFGAWLNADDWYEPGALVQIFERLKGADPPDVLIARARMVDAAGDTTWAPAPPDPVTPAALLRLKSNWFDGAMICQPEAFFRLSTFRQVGGLDAADHYAMDHALWVDFALRGARFESIDRCIACMQIHAGQKSADNRSVVRAMLRTCDRVIKSRANALGPDLPAVESEFRSMRHKLACADALSARWRVWRDFARRESERTHFDRAAIRAAREILRPGAAERASELERLVRPHAERLLKRALSNIRRSTIRITVTGASHEIVEGWLGRAQGRFRRREVTPAEGACDLAILGPEAPDHEASLDELWSRIEPGGAVVALGVPLPDAELTPYLRSLEVLLDRHLSTNDELILHPEADRHIQRILDEHASLRNLTGDDGSAGRLWLIATDGVEGLDMQSAMDRRTAQTIEFARFGSTWHHPLAPFPFVPGDGVRQIDMWQAGLWLK